MPITKLTGATPRVCPALALTAWMGVAGAETTLSTETVDALQVVSTEVSGVTSAGLYAQDQLILDYATDGSIMLYDAATKEYLAEESSYLDMVDEVPTSCTAEGCYHWDFHDGTQLFNPAGTEDYYKYCDEGTGACFDPTIGGYIDTGSGGVIDATHYDTLLDDIASSVGSSTAPPPAMEPPETFFDPPETTPSSARANTPWRLVRYDFEFLRMGLEAFARGGGEPALWPARPDLIAGLGPDKWFGPRFGLTSVDVNGRPRQVPLFTPGQATPSSWISSTELPGARPQLPSVSAFRQRLYQNCGACAFGYAEAAQVREPLLELASRYLNWRNESDAARGLQDIGTRTGNRTAYLATLERFVSGLGSEWYVFVSSAQLEAGGFPRALAILSVTSEGTLDWFAFGLTATIRMPTGAFRVDATPWTTLRKWVSPESLGAFVFSTECQE